MKLRSTRMVQRGRRALTMSAYVASLFSNGQQGFWGSASDLTDAKVAWRVNRFTYSEEFDNAAWLKGASTAVTRNAGTAPDGTQTADLITFSADAANADVQQVITSTLGESVPCSLWLWADPGQATSVTMFFTASNGDVIGTTFANLTTTPTRFVVSGVATGASSRFRLRCGTNQQGKSFYAWGAQADTGTVPSAYQKITDGGAIDFMRLFPTHTLFQDTLGLNPVMSVDQPLGLVLDKRLNTARGPELLDSVSAGGPYTGIGWVTTGGNTSIAIVNGEMAATFQGTGSSWALRKVGVPLVGGQTYEFQMEVRLSAPIAGAGVNINFYNETGAAGVPSVGSILYNGINNVLLRVLYTPTTTGNYSFLLARVVTDVADNGKTVYVTKASAKAVLGNHAVQSSTPSRPILSARVNKCQNFNANPTSITEGTFTGGAAGATLSIVNDAVAIAAAGLSTLCPSGIVYKIDNSAGTGTAIFAINGQCGNTNVHVSSMYVRGSPGTVGISAISGAANSSFGASTDYVRRSSLPATPTTASTAFITCVAGATVYFILNQLEEGSVASPRVQVTTGTTYDPIGWPRYFRFDGADDYLSTSSIPWNASQVTITAGAISGQSANIAVLAELGPTSGNASSFALFMPLTPGAAAAVFRSNGLSGTPSNVSTNIPVTQGAVITGQGNTVSPLSSIKVNGGATVTNTNAQGGGNYQTAPINIGARFSPASLPFMGKLYEIVVRAGETPDNTRLERFINKLMGGVYA